MGQDDKLTSEEDATSYNNYYEFGTDKDEPKELARGFKPKPWTIEIAGLVKARRTLDFDALFKALPPHCTGIVRLESGWNVTDRPIAYDYGINMAFATREDLVAYGPNPKHQEVVAKLREIADWIICDYEAPDV